MRQVLALLFLLFCLMAVKLIGQLTVENNIPLKRGLPTFESQSEREMYASYGGPNNSARMKVSVETLGNELSYKILEQTGSDFIRKRVFQKTLDGEKKSLKENLFENSGFTTDNYNLSIIERNDGAYLLRAVPKKKPGLLIDGHILVNKDWEIVYSDGRLLNNPSFWVRDTTVSITYKTLMGSILPINLESTGRVRLLGNRSILSIKYTYTSVNGVKIENQ